MFTSAYTPDFAAFGLHSAPLHPPRPASFPRAPQTPFILLYNLLVFPKSLK